MLRLCAAVIVMTLCVGKTVAVDQEPSSHGRFAVAGLEEAQVRSFLETLQSAVRLGDAKVVANLVSFPLTVDGRDHVPSKAQFVKRYPSIMDPVVKEQILSQTVEALFANSNGVMVGKGAVWFSGICDDDSPPGRCKGLRVLIVAINHGAK